jgi:transposase
LTCPNPEDYGILSIRALIQTLGYEAENSIRPFVIGRKNWLFYDTPDGAWAGATLYSIIESAKATGHEPSRYLRYLFDNLPCAKIDDLKRLLPYHLQPQQY